MTTPATQLIEATGLTKEHAEALAVLLRLGAVVYIPCDQAPEVAQLLEYEKALKGSYWTWLGPMTLSGPIRLYGKPRLRIELKEGRHAV